VARGSGLHVKNKKIMKCSYDDSKRVFKVVVIVTCVSVYKTCM
jgi:hypothetical protein